VDGALRVWQNGPMKHEGEWIEAADQALLEELFVGLGVHPDWVVGFLAAVVSGPDHVPTRAWLGAIIRDGALRTADDLALGVALLTRFYNTVGVLLPKAPGSLVPDPEDVDAVRAFCTGYAAGVTLHASWAEDDAAVLPLYVFAVLAGEVDDAEIEAPDEAPIADPAAWRRMHREKLEKHVTDLYAYWEAKGRARAPKIGRNDPCPCGSGKKHKKCCLAAAEPN
jgi:uncharacterized protein